MLGYEIVDYEGIHYNYCAECWVVCKYPLKYNVWDFIHEPFICEGCGEEVNV